MRETENNKRYKAAMQGVGMQNVKMQQDRLRRSTQKKTDLRSRR